MRPPHPSALPEAIVVVTACGGALSFRDPHQRIQRTVEDPLHKCGGNLVEFKLGGESVSTARG